MALTKLSDELLREHDLCLAGQTSGRDRWAWQDLYRMALDLESDLEQEEDGYLVMYKETLKELLSMQAKDKERAGVDAYRTAEDLPDPDYVACENLEEWVHNVVFERNDLRRKLEDLRQKGLVP